MGSDALSDVLRAVKLTGAVFFTVDVSPPWLAPVPGAGTLRPIVMPSAQHLISFHLVTAGAAGRSRSTASRCGSRSATWSCFRVAIRT